MPKKFVKMLWLIKKNAYVIYKWPLAIATFGPIYEELVNALMRKAMYSLQENEWTADQREAFRCYRTDIADTIMYCYVSTRYLIH